MSDHELINPIIGPYPKNSMEHNEKNMRWLLDRGWLGQKKINGKRITIHVTAKGVFYLTRNGTKHTESVPSILDKEFQRLSFCVLEGEWLNGSIFLFDVLSENGKTLSDMGYRERHKLLCRKFKYFGNPYVLPYSTSLVLLTKWMSEHIEGLVWRSPLPGLDCSKIIRMLKNSR